MSIRPLIYGYPLEAGKGERNFIFNVPLAQVKDHPYFKFQPADDILSSQGNSSLLPPIIVKRNRDPHTHLPYIIISGHIRKRIATIIGLHEIEVQIIDESENVLSLEDDVEIMKRENKGQWDKRQKLEFIFNHFGEALSKENRVGRRKEIKETKEVGVLIERASLGRIPRGTASRLIAEKRNELLNIEPRISNESFLKEEFISEINDSNSDSRHLSENLLLSKELNLSPELLKKIHLELSDLNGTTRLSDITKQKLRILLKDLLILSVKIKEKESIDEQIKNLKKKSEEKRESIIDHGNAISEFLSAGTIDQLKLLEKNEKENFEKVRAIFSLLSSIFQGVEKVIHAWERLLLIFGLFLTKKKFQKYIPDKNDPESSFETMSHKGGVFLDQDNLQEDYRKKIKLS